MVVQLDRAHLSHLDRCLRLSCLELLHVHVSSAAHEVREQRVGLQHFLVAIWVFEFEFELHIRHGNHFRFFNEESLELLLFCLECSLPVLDGISGHLLVLEEAFLHYLVDHHEYLLDIFLLVGKDLQSLVAHQEGQSVLRVLVALFREHKACDHLLHLHHHYAGALRPHFLVSLEIGRDWVEALLLFPVESKEVIENLRERSQDLAHSREITR